MFIYVIQAADDGPVKIGLAKDVKLRLASLQIGSPVPLKVVMSFPGSFALEQLIHFNASEFNLHGEWFKSLADVMSILEEAKAGRLQSNYNTKRIYEACMLRAKAMRLDDIAKRLSTSREWARRLIRLKDRLPANLLVDIERAAAQHAEVTSTCGNRWFNTSQVLSKKEPREMPGEPNPVDRVIKAAEALEGEGSGRQKLIRRWQIRNQALDGFRRKRYFPLERAKDAADFSGIPLRELVRPDIRDGMERDLRDRLLSD